MATIEELMTMLLPQRCYRCGGDGELAGIICDACEGEGIYDMRDLGWQHGWTTTPAIVRQCISLDHIPVDQRVRGHHVVTCYECRYSYKYDSGD